MINQYMGVAPSTFQVLYLTRLGRLFDVILGFGRHLMRNVQEVPSHTKRRWEDGILIPKNRTDSGTNHVRRSWSWLLFVVCCLLFVVCCLLFVVCCLLFVVCCLLFVVCFVVCCLLFVVCCSSSSCCCCCPLVVVVVILLFLLLLLIVLLIILVHQVVDR